MKKDLQIEAYNENAMLEMNRLIAEFMEWEYDNDNDWYFTPHRVEVTTDHGEPIYDNEIPVMLFEFNSSWEWLMPVVNKIEGMNIEIGGITTSPDVIIVYGDCTIQDENDKKLFNFYHHSIDSKDKLGATYKVVVEFIKWYNEQTNK